jgi:SOS-response transcriptional repressor LexA
MLLAKDLFSSVSAEQDGIMTGPTFEEVLDLVTAYVDERVEATGESQRQDVGIYYWRRQVFDVLQTAVQDAPTDTETIPIPGDPAWLRTGDVTEFKWPGIAAEAKKTHWSKVPCHTQLEADFVAFLDGAHDVVKYVKNERLAFSVTYYENFRPRQYFLDFAVLVKGSETWWLVETKGEIRTNTKLKREAANLWCDRISRSGRYGEWRHLFVQQRKFERAMRDGVGSFKDLLVSLGTEKARPELTLIPNDDPRVEKERFKTLLPVYSLEAAAGYFGRGKAVELESWVEVEGVGRLSEEMFVARAVGCSMEPQIKDGDYLIFRAHPKGTRQNKIVLAQGPIEDPELGGPFTVKKYSSEKVVEEDGSWRHSKVTLAPLNKEFEPIELPVPGDGESEIKIVAEYLGTLEP